MWTCSCRKCWRLRWWQVRHWWYNHVSGPLGGWWETILINRDPELMASLAEAEWEYLYEEAKMARHYPGDIGCPGLDDFDDREERG